MSNCCKNDKIAYVLHFSECNRAVWLSGRLDKRSVCDEHNLCAYLDLLVVLAIPLIVHDDSITSREFCRC